ncbi:unnamed protein product [Symbiodinium sp. CCMP2592]|nr:unnamed protein product [Symbiodinium sp. CCMP2592]
MSLFSWFHVASHCIMCAVQHLGIKDPLARWAHTCEKPDVMAVVPSLVFALISIAWMACLGEVTWEMSRCGFEIDTCLWLNTGNASWQRASGQATDGWLEAEGNTSDGQLFIIESPMLTAATEEKGLVFSYMMIGSRSVSLEVEHKTELSGWSTLFAESGDTGTAWKGASIRVPEGTVGLRLLAGAGVGSVVKVDWILAVETANWTDLGCTFEVDFCGWSSGFENRWRIRRGHTGTAATGPGAAFDGSWYVYTEANWARNEAFILTSPMFERSNVTRQFGFAYNMYGKNMGSLQLESLGRSHWTTLWLQAGPRDPRWETYYVAIPQDAEMLRFVGITGDGIASDMALDGLAVGVGALPPGLDLEHLACDFAWDTCRWLNTGNASWQRASGQATDGWLEAEGNTSDGQLFIIESPMLTAATAEKGLVFSYMMIGSSSVSLEVEHKTELSGWSTLFAESGDTGTAWKGASIRVPEGTVGLRLLAGAGVGSVVKVDWILAVETANWTDLGCTFEVDFCGWSSGFENQKGHWSLRRGQTGTSYTGPERAFEGDRYIFTEASAAFNEAFILTSPMFERSNVTRQFGFAYNMYGENMGSLRLESLGRSHWTTLWLQAGPQAPRWKTYYVAIPQDAEMLRFVGITGTEFRSDMALDGLDVGVGIPVLGLEHLACDFAWDTCRWLNTGNASWQRASGRATDGWLEAEGNTSDGQLFIIESPMLTAATAEKGLVFSYMITGSSSVSFEVEHKTELSGWSTLFAESGDTGTAWKGASIRVPEGTVGVRVLASLSAGEKATVGVISVADVSSSFANLSCSFEADHCGWFAESGVWSRFAGPQSSFTGPGAAFRSDFYIATAEHMDAILTPEAVLMSPLFPAAASKFFLEFSYHMTGASIDRLELQYLRRGRWSRRWARWRSQGNAWLQGNHRDP